MRRQSRHYSTTSPKPALAPSRSEADRLADHWGVASCMRCGRTQVMGEPFVRLSHDPRAVLCPDCLGAVPEVPTWIAAPRRLDATPVRLVAESGEIERAA